MPYSTGWNPCLFWGPLNSWTKRLPWTWLMIKLIEFEYELGGPKELATQQAPGSQGKLIYFTSSKVDDIKGVRRRFTWEEFREFKKRTPFSHAFGCWIFVQESHWTHKSSNELNGTPQPWIFFNCHGKRTAVINHSTTIPAQHLPVENPWPW